MQVTVLEASLQQVVLTAPLAPNINHRETVFGGSASAVTILAAWSMLHLGLAAEGLGSRLVIQIYGSASDKKEVSLSTSVVNRTAAGTKTIIDASLPEGHKHVVTKGSGGLRAKRKELYARI